MISEHAYCGTTPHDSTVTDTAAVDQKSTLYQSTVSQSATVNNATVIGSTVGGAAIVTDSVLIGSSVTGAARVTGATLIDCTVVDDVEINGPVSARNVKFLERTKIDVVEPTALPDGATIGIAHIGSDADFGWETIDGDSSPMMWARSATTGRVTFSFNGAAVSDLSLDEAIEGFISRHLGGRTQVSEPDLNRVWYMLALSHMAQTFREEAKQAGTTDPWLSGPPRFAAPWRLGDGTVVTATGDPDRVHRPARSVAVFIPDPIRTATSFSYQTTQAVIAFSSADGEGLISALRHRLYEKRGYGTFAETYGKASEALQCR